jgi:serine/threonine protein kinase
MRVGKYETEAFLGGGMSEVYRARDTVLGRTVALKILTVAASADKPTKDRFLLEARLSSGIAHDNIVTTYDYGEEDGRPFMVMEFLVGQTLRQAIAANTLPDIPGRVRIALQVARALERVHALDVLHRDVKPDNVHLDANGRAKLMDFGIAKTQQVSLTRTGFTLGTPHYMAPEMLTGQPATPQVDVYSFGIMLFELLCGRKPIDADTVERISSQSCMSLFQSPNSSGPGFPRRCAKRSGCARRRSRPNASRASRRCVNAWKITSLAPSPPAIAPRSPPSHTAGFASVLNGCCAQWRRPSH